MFDDYGTAIIKIGVVMCFAVFIGLIAGEFFKFRKAKNTEQGRYALIKLILSVLFIMAVTIPLLFIFGRVFFI